MKSVASLADLQRLALAAGAEAEHGGRRFNAGAAGTVVQPARPQQPSPTPAPTGGDELAREMRAVRESLQLVVEALDRHSSQLDALAQALMRERTATLTRP